MAYEVFDYTSNTELRTANQNRVLRNTYGLLALSMIPTIIGAWVGVKTGIGVQLFSGILGIILFLAVAFGMIFLIQKNRNSGIGVALLLAFTFFMGLVLSVMLTYTLRFSNGSELIMYAFGGTALSFFGMASLAGIVKRDLSNFGKFLFVGLIMLIIANVANMFFQSTMMVAVLSALGVGLFSAYILYDLKRIMNGGETNYVSATLSLYISIFNVFQNLLALFGIFGGSND